MIESMSEKLAVWLKGEVPEHPFDIDRLQFGFHFILNTVFTLSAAILLGLLFGNLMETLQVLLVFGLLRMITGGFHFKSATICIVVSAGVAVLLPYITLSSIMVTAVNSINVILILIFAPSGIDNQTRIPQKYYPLLKLLGLIIVASNFIFQSELLGLTWLIQTISLIHFLAKGGEKHEETSPL